MSLQLGLKHLKQVREKKGQVAIEFIIVSVVVFFFLLFFLSFALVLVVSEYVEFATFMAARTLKAGHVSQTVQETNATGVFQSYMQRVGTLVKNPSLSFIAADPQDPQGTLGAIATYTVDLFYLPPVYLLNGQPLSRITLHSEAHLGRDPSYIECRLFFNQFAAAHGLGLEGTNLVLEMEDNGC